MPAAYFHVKSIVKKQVAWQSKDWIHLVPFIIFLISYLPFYFEDFETKSNYVARILNDMSLIQSDNIGLLPEFINNLGRIIQPIVYIILQWGLLKSADGVLLKATQKTLFRWLLNFVRIQTFLFSSLLATVFTSQYFFPAVSVSFFEFIPLFLTVSSFFILSIYLFWNQNILQKIKYFNPNEKTLDHNNTQLDINTISEIVFTNKYFLGKENDLVGVANQLEINKADLSKLIKTKYVNFNAWINTLKVSYSMELIKEGYLNDFSIEALAATCGFNSTSTFYRAFKAQTETTPKEYASSFN
ncbi:helix-turn-helix domain-containing protein [uncultured Polaribacter sp.]|uniref:helix-turn-helix domain-containing protein n=1 Tax=uncultured Polaribacter sp. TaxID=174711 RepID=UPI002624723F|nr:helix-turn-helix domain-containing protein [uncultured Polaribacter sp.]